MDTLGQIQEPRKLVIPALLEAVESRSLEVAMKGSHRLWRLGGMQDEVLLRILVKVLAVEVSSHIEDGIGYFPVVRHEAARILAEMGPRATSALPALEKALKTSELTFRAHVAHALWKIGGESQLERTIDALAGVLRQPADPSTSRKQLRGTIGLLLGEMGAEAVPRILVHLEDEDEQVRMGMLEGLKRMGRTASSARPAVVAKLKDHHFRVRDSAAEALEEIGVEPEGGERRMAESED